MSSPILWEYCLLSGACRDILALIDQVSQCISGIRAMDIDKIWQTTTLPWVADIPICARSSCRPLSNKLSILPHSSVQVSCYMDLPSMAIQIDVGAKHARRLDKYPIMSFFWLKKNTHHIQKKTGKTYCTPKKSRSHQHVLDRCIVVCSLLRVAQKSSKQGHFAAHIRNCMFFPQTNSKNRMKLGVISLTWCMAWVQSEAENASNILVTNDPPQQAWALRFPRNSSFVSSLWDHLHRESLRREWLHPKNA